MNVQGDGESNWVYGTGNDEFGDPIEGAGFVMNREPLEGTFDNSATYNSPLWAQMQLNEYGFNLWFYLYQNMNQLYRNNFSIYDETFNVSIKDESGEVHFFFGFMLVDDCFLWIVDNKKAYERIDRLEDLNEADYDGLIALFMKEQELKFSITAEEGADRFSFKLNTAGFADAYGKTVSPLKVYGDKATVQRAQTALNEAGYDCGTPDGIAGKGTSAAVAQYPTDHGLNVTGTITHELLIALGLISA